MEQKILSITQINEYIRSAMDTDPILTSLAVRGEISNYKCYPSGHHYFTLKDENAALKCVMFKASATRLRFRPENGMKVIAFGRITVYPRDGAYQLYCTAMTVDGVGDLHAAFEQLKSKLEAQGLFDPAHKKTIPAFPTVVGIVTSSAGAAVHDILRILNKRWPSVRVRILPVRVQGAEAPPEIAAAIRFANAHKLADVLIVGRGGGSIEDLWAFNDERVAYAIYDSDIPVISAVGHEPDVTISDYVADLRAATPSNAAELAVPDQNTIYQHLDHFNEAMASALKKQLFSARRHLNTLSQSAILQDPRRIPDQKALQLSALQDRLISAADRSVARKKQQYIALTAKLDAMSPLKVLSRGYSMVTDPSGTVIRSVKQLQENDIVRITLGDGTCAASISEVKENKNG